MEHDVEEVSVSRLRQSLPAFLGKVRRGAVLRVTSRGKAIAEIRAPIQKPDAVHVARARLRGSVRRYARPTAPAFAEGEWDMHG
jgi:antitoxin (DNA-binding transcriptional repressor) of toxin-antitoxin stability system